MEQIVETFSDEGLLARFAAATVKNNDELKKTLTFFGKNRRPIDEYKGLIAAEFHVVHMMLDFIAKKNDLDPYDQQVIEAYIIGNELLDGKWDYSNIESIAKEKTGRNIEFPLPVKPHHNTWAKYVGLLKKEEPSEDFKKNCMVVPYMITDEVNLEGSSIHPYVPNSKKLENSYDLLKNSDDVAVHRGVAIEKLSKYQYQNLANYGFSFFLE